MGLHQEGPRRGPITGRPAVSNGYLPNQINEDLKLLENYRIRQKEADEYARARGRTSRYDYEVGDRVYIQDIKTKQWSIKGTIIDSRPASDGSSPRSFLVEGDLGGTYLRNAKFLCPATQEGASDSE